MDVQLKILVGAKAGRTIKVIGPRFYIGRSEECHLRPNSDLISRHHCVFIVENGYVGVRDFDSKNGTFVNGEPVSSERELKPGDRLKVGPLEFEVLFEPLVPGAEKQAPAGTGKETIEETDLEDWLVSEAGMEGKKSRPSDSTTDDLLRPGSSTIEEPLAPPAPKEQQKHTSPASGSGSDEAAAEMLRKLRRFR